MLFFKTERCFAKRRALRIGRARDAADKGMGAFAQIVTALLVLFRL